MAREAGELVPRRAVVATHEKRGIVDARIPCARLRFMAGHDLPDVFQLRLRVFGEFRIALHAGPGRAEVLRGPNRRAVLEAHRAGEDAAIARVAAQAENLPAA